MLQQTQVVTVIRLLPAICRRRCPPCATWLPPTRTPCWRCGQVSAITAVPASCIAPRRSASAQHGGELPRDFDALAALPGIGRSTAGAILAQAHGLRFPILDGNVKRVLTRYLGIHGHPGQSAVEKVLWQHAECTSRRTSARRRLHASDHGSRCATVCIRSRPQCDGCPFADTCVAQRDGLTAQLPSAKPTKTIPTRATVMLILRDAQGRVLLERRGPQGVWSGLWSLPEASRSRWRLARGAILRTHRRRAGPAALHARIQPLPPATSSRCCSTRRQPHRGIADNPALRWCDAGERAALGLPAPVRSLLLGL